MSDTNGSGGGGRARAVRQSQKREWRLGGTAPAIERASPNDLMQLALDTGPVPMHFAAVVTLQPRAELAVDEALAALRQRLNRVPRLRQRLVKAPIGCGRPYWLDDGTFDVNQHSEIAQCPGTGDDAALMAMATTLAFTALAKSRPRWSATVVTGLAGGRLALILVLHHVIADGLGGLAFLTGLLDSEPELEDSETFDAPPRQPPSATRLAGDAWSCRLRSVVHASDALHRVVTGFTELTGSHPGMAPRSTLNRPTGLRRSASAVKVELATLAATAHAHGSTVNDVILCAVTGALRDLSAARGEVISNLVVSVPVSERPAAARSDLGNHVGAMAVALPLAGEPTTRLESIAAMTKLLKKPSRGASAAILEPAFRAMAALHLLRYFINHQRLVNTFITNIRGPAAVVTFMDAPVTSIIPISGVYGNTAVGFSALSYAGTLTVTVMVDPDSVPELSTLAASLRNEIEAIVTGFGTSGPTRGHQPMGNIAPTAKAT